MLHRISCNMPSFRPVSFMKGFNIVLAHLTDESKRHDTRNGVGKSSLFKIINFCLGGSIRGKDVLAKQELTDWKFTLDFSISDKKYQVTRSVSNPKSVVAKGNFTSWDLPEGFDSDDTEQIFSTNLWKDQLGNQFFGLDLKREKYTPSFRSLMRFSIRSPVNFDDTFRTAKNQSAWEVQVNSGFLMGLEWQDATQIKIISNEIERLQKVSKVIKDGVSTGFFKTVGEMEAEKVQLEERIETLQSQLSEFRVLPQYHEISRESNELTIKIQEFANSLVMFERYIEVYNQTIEEEKDVSLEEVSSVYKEVRFVFVEHVRKKLEEVQEFHETVLKNRKEYLQQEISKIKAKITEAETKIKKLTEERTKLMSILKSSGTLEEFSAFQERLNVVIQKHEEIKSRIAQMERIESESDDWKLKMTQMIKIMRQDLRERKQQVDKIRLLFSRYSRELYASAGRLSIDVNDTGYTFNADIDRSGSQGIDNMRTFCYDLALVKYRVSKGYNPRFLAHDSHIFDPVDARQISSALELASREANTESSFQYICALNSDDIPYDLFSDDFRRTFDASVAIELTDTKPEGALLGIWINE